MKESPTKTTHISVQFVSRTSAKNSSHTSPSNSSTVTGLGPINSGTQVLQVNHIPAANKAFLAQHAIKRTQVQ